MDDYFDENDLINDYIEHNEYPPEEEEPDDYYEDEPQPQQLPSQPTKQPEDEHEHELAKNDETLDEEANLDVPTVISTKLFPTKNDDMYEFERYSGLSSWRSVKKSTDAMEATGWKKSRPNNEEGPDNEDDSDSDDLDQIKCRNSKRSAPESENMASEGYLVHMNKMAEEEMLGRSWGVRRSTRDVRFVQKEESTSLPKLGEDSVVLTMGDGNSVNVRLIKCSNKTIKDNTEGKESLSGINELVKRADVLQKRAVKRKLEREERRAKRSKVDAVKEADDDDVDMNEANPANDNNQNEIPATKETKLKTDRAKLLQMRLQQRLWVDKHAPRNISHLLSEERTNREVLRALKGWDPYVFKREAPVRPVPLYGNYKGQQQQQQNDKQSGGKGKKWEKKEEGGDKTEVKDVRPEENARVILLSGPPGVGKTTLAHIVCRHAGYRPIEVNASDERSASALTERVTRAMESSTLVLDKESDSNKGRPNCIILDEVDGADAKSAISAIVDIVRAEIPAKGKKGRKSPYLRRPIILICNHKHAPALRPILPYAKQFDVKPPNPERLASRLRAVLAAENMSVVAGGMLLHRLVASTGGDVRSCLYALQFASARAREVAMRKREKEGIVGGDNVVVDISSTLMAALGDTGNGMKDMQSDVATAVSAVFRKDKSKRTRQRKTAGDKVEGQRGVNLVLKTVDHFGDHSKTLDCMFMNVNRVGYVDPTLDRCAAAFEWLSGADIYRSQKSSVAMNNSAEHHAMQKYYMPSAAAAIHMLCCIETRPDLTFSTRELSDLHYQNQANVSLVHRFVEGFAPRVRSGIGGGTDVVVSDVIPYGLWLLSAGDGKHSLSKPVSSVDILSAEEKLAFSSHVATLRALGLTYVKEDRGFNDFKSNTVSSENVRLEPDIDKLVRFEHADGGFLVQRKQVPSVLRELLGHGATVAALRERESEAKTAALASNEQGEKPLKPIANTKPSTEATETKPEKRKVARNFLNIGAAKAKEAKSARRAARVGFDRSKKVKLSNTGSGVELSKVIRFKFQKGFTQAVRAPCQIEDLM